MLCVVQGITYNRRTMELEGFAEISPLAAAKQINADTGFDAVVPHVATHMTVTYYRSWDKSVSVPMAAFPVNSTGFTKEHDMLLAQQEIMSKMHARGFMLHAECLDSHKSNVVSSSQHHNMIAWL